MKNSFNNNVIKPFTLKRLHLRFYIIVVFLLFSILAKSQTASDAVDFNFKRGFYTSSFKLELSSTTPKSTIHYTLDGSIPTLTNGQIYSGPISIRSNSMVRAYTYTKNLEDSKIKTHSYIFPEQVIRQKNNMKEDYGYDYSEEITGKVFWTEEMDPEIVDAIEYKYEIIKGLKAIPTLSIVMLKEDLWGNNGIYWGNNLENRSDAFERECSIEMIYPEGYKKDSLKSWQENAGIKIQGGGARWYKGTYGHKQSFTLVFKKIYGTGKLKNEIFADAPHSKETVPGKYDNIILRAGQDKGWGADSDREKTVYTRDQLGRDLQLLMSGFGSHGTFVHLYLNGKYWGLYNPCERPDNDYLANQFGGESEDYFYAKGKDSSESDDRIGEPGQSKSRFFEACSKDYTNMTFDEMKNWVLMDQSIACFLIYGYANPGDGPQYYYGNNNNPYGPVVWTPWDIEDSFGGGSKRTGPPSVKNMIDDMTSGDNGFKALWTNIDFRMRFNDLAYKHFFNDGAMTDENVIAAWDNLNNYIYGPIICESARWGDERGDLMDRDHEWDTARLAVRNDLIGRSDDFISKLQKEGYFSTLPAPLFFNDSKEITTSVVNIANNSSFTIRRESPNGVVYYTTDGSDPRTWDLNDSISENANIVYETTTSITINNATTFKARTRNGNEWSPLHEILVLPPRPLSEFTASPDFGNYPLTVQFNDSSINKVDIWHWNFGDGTIGTEQNPLHIYEHAGIYTVSLKVIGEGGESTEIKENLIKVTTPIPIANFSGYPYSGNYPLTVQFTDASVIQVYSWLWDFGDGTIGTEQNPLHTYEHAGIYTVSLKVIGEGGESTEIKENLIKVTTPIPIANFSAYPDSGNYPLSVQFADASVNQINSWHWNFGDSTIGTERDPLHTYEHAGTYTVSLNVTGEGGENTLLKEDLILVTTPTRIIILNSSDIYAAYPNPTKGLIRIKGIEDIENSTIEIYNSNGVKLKSIKKIKQSENIDLSDLTLGVYLVCINNQYNRCIKIIKE